MTSDGVQKRLTWAGAWLFAIGLATGLRAGLVLREHIRVTIPRLALAAHLNGIVGGSGRDPETTCLVPDEDPGLEVLCPSSCFWAAARTFVSFWAKLPRNWSPKSLMVFGKG